MIYITGDTHGEFRRLLDFCDHVATTKDDIRGIDQSTVDNSTEDWLSDIEIKLDYKWWYAGHYHTSRITDKIQIMFEDIEKFGIHGRLNNDKREL